MISCLIFGIIIYSFSAVAQHSKKDIELDILRLKDYSEKYIRHSKSDNLEHLEILAARKKKYFDQIDKIKNGPDRELYIEFLNFAIDKDSLKYSKVGWFNYTPPGLDYSSKNSATKLEYFKVVRYSLFTLNKDELLLPEDVPFLRKEVKY